MLSSMFSEALVDPIKGTQIVEALGLDSFELLKPDVFHKYQDIARYFGKFEDGASVIRLVSRTATKSERLAKVYEYMHLRQQLEDVRKRKREMPISDTITGESDEARELDMKEGELIKQISIYE